MRYSAGMPLPAVFEYKSLLMIRYHRFLFSLKFIARIDVFVK